VPDRAGRPASRLPRTYEAVHCLTICLLLPMIRQQSSQAANRQSQRRTLLTR
jgi:hypothetical protein